MKKNLKLFFGLVMASFMLFGCTNGSGGKGDGISNTPNVKMDKTFYNPLDIKKGVGDPWLYKHTDGYYYYTHSMSGMIRVTKSKSPTFLKENDVDPERSTVIFRQKSIDVIEIWAPEVFFYQGRWYCYFTATVETNPETDTPYDTIGKDGARRTYVIQSKTEDLFGEWNRAQKLELPEDIRSIDATFFAYNNRLYTVYAGWPQKYNQQYRQHLYITELEDPMHAKSSETVRHLVSEPNETWERDGATAQNEGPCVCFAPDGTPILMYSGSYSGGDTYCIAYLKLVGNDLLQQSSWQKCATPLMQRDVEDSEILAPGHNSVIKSPDGKEDWICYHSAKLSGSGWDRQVRLQKMTWDGNTPVVERIYKASEEAPLPSGDNPTRYKFEAENATLTSDCYKVDKEGYASNNVASSISETTGSIHFEVAVPENGQYAVGVRYSNKDSSQTIIKVNINNTDNDVELFAPNTWYDDHFFMTWLFTDLYIKPQGQNDIVIKADSPILIDCIVIDYLDHTK